MFGILLSAFNVVMGFVFRSVIAKFFVFFALFFVVQGFIGVLVSSGLLPTAATLQSSLGGVPAGAWFWLDVFGFSAGLPMVLSACLTRFMIRRIPLIG